MLGLFREQTGQFGTVRDVESVQDGRIHIEKINWPFLSELKGSPADYGAGLKLAIERGWLAT